MLDKARQFLIEKNGIGNVEFEVADAEDLPFEDGRFDLVTCRIAPHHFPSPQRFLHESARVLRPDGVLMLQDQVLPADDEAALFVDEFERVRDPSHNRAFNAGEWQAMFGAAGLSVEYEEVYIKRHQFIPWVQRQGNDEATVAQLVDMMRRAPAIARAWMDPQEWGGENATFVNRHILIRGRLS